MLIGLITSGRSQRSQRSHRSSFSVGRAMGAESGVARPSAHQACSPETAGRAETKFQPQYGEGGAGGESTEAGRDGHA